MLQRRNLLMKNVVRCIAVFISFFAVCQRPAIHAQDQPQEISIHAKRFAFTPVEITLTKGEKATLSLTSDDVTHALVIPELGVNATITKGKVTKVDVTPQQAGSFHGQCGHFCGVGHGSMLFSVQVKDK
jgi:cytochrome c oxidase subunit 2